MPPYAAAHARRHTAIVATASNAASATIDSAGVERALGMVAAMTLSRGAEPVMVGVLSPADNAESSGLGTGAAVS